MSLRDVFRPDRSEAERARMREELDSHARPGEDLGGTDLGRTLRDSGRAFQGLDRQIQSATREFEKLVRSVEKGARSLASLSPPGGGAPGAPGGRGGGGGSGAGGGSFGVSGWGLAGLGVGFGLASSVIGAIGSIASAGSDLAKELQVFRQELRSMAGARASEGLGDYLHLGYSSIEAAQTRLGLLRGVGANNLEGESLDRIQELERIVLSGERGLGIGQAGTIGLLSAMRRSGDTMETGREGETRLQRILEDAVASGIEITRLPEYMSGIEGLLGAEQSQQAGPVSSDTLSRMLALMGGTGAPGLQGMAGIRALAQLSQGIRAPGGGDAGRSIMLMALQRGGESSYTRTLAAMERGASDPTNLRSLYQHMRQTYGLAGEPGSQPNEEALLRLSRMTGLGLSKLAGPDYAETGRVGEDSIVAALHRMTSGDDKTSDEIRRLQEQVENALADPTERIEKHTLSQAQYTERLVELGEESLKLEDGIKAGLADNILPAIQSILSFLAGGQGNEEERKQQVQAAKRLGLEADRERARLERAEGQRAAGEITDEEYQKVHASYARRMGLLKGRYEAMPEDIRSKKNVAYDPGNWFWRWGWKESPVREWFAGAPTMENPYSNLQFDISPPRTAGGGSRAPEARPTAGLDRFFGATPPPAASGSARPSDAGRQAFAFEHNVRVVVDGPPASSQVTSRANPVLGR